MAQILYQNIETGDAHDITTLVTSASWKTKRTGSPAQLDLTLVSDPAVEITEGGIVTLTEDGIGLMRYLEDTVDRALAKAKPARPYRGTIATGQAAYPLLCRIAEKCSQRLGIELRVVRVENRFFGERITVAGLLTGQDLYRALKKEDLGEIVYISRSTQRADEDVFLDDMSLLELQQALGVPVRTLENDGEAFVEALCQGKEYR